MANLKLIKVTGSPFCSTLYGCIGIQVDDNNFNVIKGGGLNTQSSYSGCGWEYATAEEIAENWKLIYPHWIPERGDNVIVTQDYGSWANQRGTIVEASSSVGYYRVKRKEGNLESFDYTCQMILAPYNEIKVESKETTMTKFKIGDRVQCINKSMPGYLKTGTVRETGEGNVGVEFDEYMSGHTLQGQCKNGYGWYIEPKDLDIVLSTKPKEETVIVRFLTEQEFKDKGLWNDIAPRGWNSRGDMNKYLGQSIVIPKSSIRSDGFFTYESWGFSRNDYLITTGVPSEPKPTESISGEIYSPPKRFNIGDKVMYKVHSALPRHAYFFGGTCQGGFVGEIRDYIEYISDQGCWKISVTTSKGYCYGMLEKEFVQYDGKVVKPSEPIQPIQSTTLSKPQPKFYVGKPVTYKNFRDCGGKYYFSGEDKGGFVGTITSYDYYVEEKNCYKIYVTTPMGHTYMMLESEFEEYDPSYITVNISSGTGTGISGLTVISSSHQVLTDIRASVGGPSLTLDPLSSYKQTPITMKTKPKSKLRVI